MSTTQTQQAVVYYGPQDVRCERVPLPECTEDEIRVRVDACAVCGSDLKAFRSGNPRIRAPMVMGHEFTGRVEHIGRRVSGFALGQRVVMATSVSCGRCLYCRRGWRNLCVELAPMGFSYPGGMAQWVTIPRQALQEGHVIGVPEGVPAEQAALAEPISCAVNSAANSNIQPGDVVAVLGAGPMGILNACVARQCGAAKVLLSEINPSRLAQAAEFGFDRLINPAEEDLRQAVLAETEGYGADVAIVAAPAAAPQEVALNLVRRRGTVCLFASLPVGRCNLSIDARVLHYGELRVVGSSDSSPEHVRRAVEMLASGRLPAAKLVTHCLPLDRIQEAFGLMESGQALRVVLHP